MLNIPDKVFNQGFGLFPAHPHLHRDAFVSQPANAAPADKGIGILCCQNHPLNTGLYYFSGAWRRFAIMIAWLKGHIKICTCGTLPRIINSLHFRMGKAGSMVPSPANNSVFPDHHCSNHGVGRSKSPALCSKFKGFVHILDIIHADPDK